MSDVHGESSAFLSIRHRPDGLRDVGELLVEARAPEDEFSGTGSAYFNDSAVLAFAARLATYPLTDREPTAISGGVGGPVDGPQEYQELVGIAVVPIGSLGQLGVQVHIARGWPDRTEMRPEVRLSFLTTYERMRRFSRELQGVVGGELSEARLEEEVLA
jgi:hypothetical protein